jgi:6-pyruvoyltetrahydropterin/6-carboxytetrahydropterin synthase
MEKEVDKKKDNKEKFTLTKVVTTETAHRLYPYEGKCSFIHGHSYKFEVSIEGETDDSMLLDFNMLKQVINKVIVSFIDHTLVLWKDDPLYAILNLEGTYDKTLIDWQEMPTAESFAKVFSRQILYEIKYSFGIKLTKVIVIVWETETSSASYSLDNIE